MDIDKVSPDIDDQDSALEENDEENPGSETPVPDIDDYIEDDDGDSAAADLSGERHVNSARGRTLLMSLLAALIGAVLGPLPVILFVYLTGSVFYPLFIVAPLLAYLFNNLLGGGRDIRSFIAIAVFTLLCTYITAIACQATLYILKYGISFIKVAPLTFEAFGKAGVLPASASGYAYPLIFTALGLVVDWEFLRTQGTQSAGCEDLQDVVA